jgi:chromosome segregation ATPase
MVLATEAAQWITLGIALLGVAGLIFTALKYNRDDTTAVIGQQDTILADMKSLNDELRQARAAAVAERDELRTQVATLTGQLSELRRELADANRRLEGKVTRIERRLGDADQ